MGTKDERQSINESVAIIEDSVTTSLDEITQDTESIAISIDTISKVAKVVGYSTVAYITVKIVFAIFRKS
jgi:hypothetical protein